ncbi:MAG: DUF4339 domain-containing protein [Pirellula sp.]
MDWYVQIGIQQRGPINSEELRKLASEGIVTPTTPIRQGYDGKWSVAGRVSGLSFEKKVAVQPPPILPSSDPATKCCPFCAEEIQYSAIKCKHCGEFLTKDIDEVKIKRQSLEWNREDLRKVIIREQNLIIAVAISAVCHFFPISFVAAEGEFLIAALLLLPLRILEAVLTYRLAKITDGDQVYATWLAVFIFLPIPLVNFVAIFIATSRASTILRQHGLKVSILGASIQQLDSMRTIERIS